MDTAEYCREIETYLCRKNEGHLVRIVGPAFEQVCGWAALGIPLKVVFRAIDQYCERYYRKGPRRRPIRIEFCEADVLELFDGWRRAVGVLGDGPPADAAEPPPRKAPLASHIERAVARLTTLRSGPHRPVALDTVIDEVVRELEAMNAQARQARGDARARIIDDLARIDRRVIEASTGTIDANAARALRRDAEEELAAFGSRLLPEVRSRATVAAFERLVREALGVPVIAYE